MKICSYKLKINAIYSSFFYLKSESVVIQRFADASIGLKNYLTRLF